MSPKLTPLMVNSQPGEGGERRQQPGDINGVARYQAGEGGMEKQPGKGDKDSSEKEVD